MSNTTVELLERVPPWLLRPLPANATIDEKLIKSIDKLGGKVITSVYQLTQLLQGAQAYAEYDAAANRASAHVWLAIENFHAGDTHQREELLRFTMRHMRTTAQVRILRRMLRHPDPATRTAARRVVSKNRLPEVSLPAADDGAWDNSGWMRGSEPQRLFRHRAGERVQQRYELPALSEMSDVREMLKIKSVRQLGYFLVASDHENGPYTRFTIAKRGGEARVICAPKAQLLYVQRRILREILDKVAIHPAAHGFVPGRSTVTNAAPHVGAEIVVKFDLTDFFPTIHYYRVMGLFASLGYAVGDTRFSNQDDARQIAPALARLCTYAENPRQYGGGVLPQGAPTSPAISNLICRTLDARLDGLAKKMGATYTRYADDLTFSFRDTETDLGRFRWWVDQVCHQEGFLINQRKYHAIRKSQRQSVTGVVVNDALRVPRPQRRRFRAMLHNCRVHGVASQARGNTSFVDYLRGFASYIYMIHPEEGAELLREVEEILTGTDQ